MLTFRIVRRETPRIPTNPMPRKTRMYRSILGLTLFVIDFMMTKDVTDPLTIPLMEKLRTISPMRVVLK